jgi:hypothetical protein
MWVAATELSRSQGHRFYEKLNELLAEAGFDRCVEEPRSFARRTSVSVRARPPCARDGDVVRCPHGETWIGLVGEASC